MVLQASWIGGRLPQSLSFSFFFSLWIQRWSSFLLHLSFLSLSECTLLPSLIPSFSSSDTEPPTRGRPEGSCSKARGVGRPDSIVLVELRGSVRRGVLSKEEELTRYCEGRSN